MRCRNSRRMPELPTVGTPDSRQNSQPSRHLKTSHWPLVVHTGHVRYDQDSEPSKSVKRETSELPTIGTPDSRRNSRPSILLKTSRWALTKLKYVRCRNSRCMPELPIVGTPDSRRNSQPSRLLKTSRWPLVMRTVNPLRQLK